MRWTLHNAYCRGGLINDPRPRPPPPPRCGERRRQARGWAVAPQAAPRQKAGKIILRLEVDEVNLVVALVDLGLLDPLFADDRIAIEKAAEKHLQRLGETIS
jgi:hypothetical protein